MDFKEDKVSVKHLSTHQLKSIYIGYSTTDSHNNSTELMAEIENELNEREFMDQVRGGDQHKRPQFDLNNPYIKWGLIGSGVLIGLLFIQSFTRPSVSPAPYPGMNQINIYR